MTEPIRRANELWIEDLDDEIVILVGDTDQVHVLNESAAELWRLVDGERDADALAAAFADLYPDAPRAAIEADGRELVGQWRTLGLIRSED